MEGQPEGTSLPCEGALGEEEEEVVVVVAVVIIVVADVFLISDGADGVFRTVPEGDLGWIGRRSPGASSPGVVESFLKYPWSWLGMSSRKDAVG